MLDTKVYTTLLYIKLQKFAFCKIKPDSCSGVDKFSIKRKTARCTRSLKLSAFVEVGNTIEV